MPRRPALNGLLRIASIILQFYPGRGAECHEYFRQARSPSRHSEFCGCSTDAIGKPVVHAQTPTVPARDAWPPAPSTAHECRPNSTCNTTGVVGNYVTVTATPTNDIPFVRSPYLWSDLQHPQYFRNNDGAHSMKLKQIWDDTRGSALVEFTVTLPLFLLLTFGLLQAGLLLYTQAGLQHGVEVAARCASVNYSANQLGLSQSCFTVGGSQAPSRDTTTIKTYAAQNSWGLNPSLSTSNFTVTGGTIGTCEYVRGKSRLHRLPQAILIIS